MAFDREGKKAEIVIMRVVENILTMPRSRIRYQEGKAREMKLFDASIGLRRLQRRKRLDDRETCVFKESERGG
jgi:hypothetical protein